MKRKWFRRSWLKFLKYGAAIIAGVFYIWTLIVLGKNDNWVGISALTTMLLAIAAFWSIMESRSDRRKDMRDHALDNILTWAEVLDKTIAASIFDFTGADKHIRMRELLDTRRQLITIAKVVRSVKNSNLSSLVDKVRSDMDEYMEVPKDKPTEEKRQELRRSIIKLINTVIEIQYSQLE